MDEQHNNNQQSGESRSATGNATIRSDDDLMAEFAAKINEEREHWQEIIGRESDSNPAYHFAKMQLDSLERDSPERRMRNYRRNIIETERQRLHKETQARQSDSNARRQIWLGYIRSRGRRYEPCRLNNFEVTTDKQSAAVATLEQYAANSAEYFERGQNLVLYGPSGTGKDHLVTGVVHRAICAIENPSDGCRRVAWIDGPSLFAAVRAEIGNPEFGSDIVHELANAWLLVLSDLLPPSAKLTDFQSDVVYRIIETRYSSMKPTLLSVNVRNRAELNAGLGVAVADRLIHGAVTISCEWPSYRKPERLEIAK